MTTGAVALVGAPTLGYGTTGAGVALVMAGAGTTHGDGTAGVAALAGAVASVGVAAGPVAGDLLIGAVALVGAGAVIMVMAGTEDTIEVTITEVMLIIEVEGDIPIL